MNKNIYLTIIGIVVVGVLVITAISFSKQKEPIPVETSKNATTTSEETTHTSIVATTTTPTNKIITPVQKTKPEVINNSPQTLTVVIKGYAFTPQTIKIKKGTTVKWVNKDIAKHTVTADNGSFASDFFGQSESYSHTFTETGTWNYHCEPHPYMKATIVVTE